MARTKPRERARERVLTDDELRAVWKAAVGLETAYGYLVRFILLTATRVQEAARLNRSEISRGGDEWVIPARRHKSKRDFLLPLSQTARDLLASIPEIGRKGWVFTSGGDKPINGFSKAKRQLDERTLAAVLVEQESKVSPIPHWVLHDLRRTAKSLMSRAGVLPNHSERALGHVIAGVEGTYDRYSYSEEKRRAFEALADQVERILKPRANVVALRTAR